jgi:hypothetical protein
MTEIVNMKIADVILNVKRELTYFPFSVARKLKRPFVYIRNVIRLRRYDRTKGAQIKITEGDNKISPKVALLLLFQPNGIAKSTLYTCERLKKAGFSVLTVSNCPLRDSDLMKLQNFCFAIMERPNFGYDFGGYRDGLLYLKDLNVDLKKVFIINDSVWFPIFEDSSFFDSMEESKSDIFGGVLAKDKFEHIQSYSILFNEGVLKSPDFFHFWNNLLIASDHRWTILNCELLLTEWFKKRGFSIDAAYRGYGIPNNDIYAVASKLSMQELSEVLDFQKNFEIKRLGLEDFLNEKSLTQEWRERALQLIHDRIICRHLNIAHPIFQEKLKLPFIKKTRSPEFEVFRKEIAKVNNAKINPIILEEILLHDI